MTTTSLSLRIAEAKDAAAVASLIESAYRGDDSRRGWTSEADLIEGNRTSTAEIASFIADPHTKFLMAYVADDLVGCALIRRENEIGYFGMFAVKPTLQGGGNGKVILDFAEKQARELWRCRAMSMTVISIREELIAYYERRGYRRSDTKPFPFDREPGAKRTDFHFVVLTKALVN